MPPSSSSSRKPVLGEESFQKLLAAAFVVQEHNQQRTDDSQSAAPPQTSTTSTREAADPSPAYAYVMDEIVATQHQIQTRRLELHQAMDLILQRILLIAHADGAAIALVEGDELVYHTALGISSSQRSKGMKIEQTLCAESVCNGATLRCADASADFRLDSDICRRRGAAGVISVPVYRDEAVAGALEIIFAKRGAFGDTEVRSCQLMAGLVTEALDRDADQQRKHALAAERATMLGALERLKPQLERIIEAPLHGSTVAKLHPAICDSCGALLGERDQICQHCGTQRKTTATASQPSFDFVTEVQGAQLETHTPDFASGERANLLPPELDRSSKPQSSMLKAPEPLRPRSLSQQTGAEFEIPSGIIDELEARIRELDPDRSSSEESFETVSDHSLELDSEADSEPMTDEGGDRAPTELVPDAQLDNELRITPAPPEKDAWTSAAKARAWLESITDPRSRGAMARFVKHRRAELYLTCAILLVSFAVWWSLQEGPSDVVGANATVVSEKSPAGHRKIKPPDADLSLFEKLLVAVGLAEAPSQPVYLGNPDTRVWVDLQTALYYCPHADLYGKTPKGKFTSQKDAQLDQFEPAYRRACD